MSEKEIKDLAREYAESNIPKGIDEEYSRSIVSSDGEMFERFLNWLSDRFCLVEKSEAEKLARLTFENGSSEDFGLIDGLVDWVEDNFTEEYHNVCENG